MANRQSSFEKRARDKAKKEKAAAKRARRAERSEAGGLEAIEAADHDADGVATPPPSADAGDVMARLARLHEQYDDGAIDFDTFEERKADLLAQLSVD